MSFWTSFSEEMRKMAEKSSSKLNLGAGTGQTFRTKEEVEKYRAGIRQHLSKPEVAARVAARRNRVLPNPKVKGKGKAGLIAKAVGLLSASGGLGYLLGRRNKKGTANEPA